MKNILITGLPRVGKTTLIEFIFLNHDFKALGFLTREIREGNYRTGFEIETLSGHKKILASKTYFSAKHKVGKYGVYINNLDYIVRKLFKEIEEQEYDLIIIDEIGKMELFSLQFKNLVYLALEQGKLLGTIMLRDNKFTKEIKNREDTYVIELTKENRTSTKDKIIKMLI